MKPIKATVIFWAVFSSLILGLTNAVEADSTIDVIQQVESENCQGSTELTYQSPILKAPDRDLFIYYQAILRRVGRRGDRQGGSYCSPPVGRETPVLEMFVENGTSVSRIPLEPFDHTYLIAKPISFSPDGRYIVVEYLMAYDGGDVQPHYKFLDSQNGYRDIGFNICNGFAPNGTSYQGFISPSEILFSCSSRSIKAFWIVNLEQRSSYQVSSLPASASTPQSYGTVTAELSVLKKQVFPRRY